MNTFFSFCCRIAGGVPQEVKIHTIFIQIILYSHRESIVLTWF